MLICDDERPLRALVRASLEGRGYLLAEARDGTQALELARRLRPDLILLDLMMPGRDGLSVLAEIRADADLADTLVVMLTARAQQPERTSAAESGADGFITKPFSPVELARVVDDLLRSRS